VDVLAAAAEPASLVPAGVGAVGRLQNVKFQSKYFKLLNTLYFLQGISHFKNNFMYTKLFVAIVLTICILAFPINIFELTPTQVLWFRIGKAILFCFIIYKLIRKLGTELNFPLNASLSWSKIKLLLPVTAALLLYVVLNQQKIFGHEVHDVTSILLILFSTYVAATGEEFIFRGYVFYVLRNANKSVVSSALISTFLFAVIHSINFTRHGDIWSTFNQVVFAFGFGILLSAVFIISKNIWFTGIFHTIVNLPAAFSKFTYVENAVDALEQTSSLSDNIISSLLYILLISPVFLLGWYYLKVIKKLETKLTLYKGKNDIHESEQT
jgi:membrane protease YdiL (CAAX protease family)